MKTTISICRRAKPAKGGWASCPPTTPARRWHACISRERYAKSAAFRATMSVPRGPTDSRLVNLEPEMQKVLDRIHLSYIMFENRHFHLPESQNGKRRQHVAGWLDTVFAEMHCMLVFPVNGMRKARHFVQQCQSRNDRHGRPAGSPRRSLVTSRPEKIVVNNGGWGQFLPKSVRLFQNVSCDPCNSRRI